MGGCYSAPSSTESNLHCLPSISNVDDDDDDEDHGRRSSVDVSDLRRRYRIGAELGRGEFGVTRRCTDGETGEALACKSVSKRKSRGTLEVEIMRRLPEHPNIVWLREASEDGESLHLVMEICEGGELFDRIVARGHYTERAAAVLAKTIIEVVQVRIAISMG